MPCQAIGDTYKISGQAMPFEDIQITSSMLGQGLLFYQNPKEVYLDLAISPKNIPLVTHNLVYAIMHISYWNILQVAVAS